MANAKLFQSKLFDVSGGNSGGVSNYEELSNLPSINGTVLKGNLSATDLGLAGLNYKGTITNELPSEEPNNGDFWVVTENVDDLAGISFEAGDWLIWNNGKWDKIENFDAVNQDDIQQINAQIEDIYSQFRLKQDVITGAEGEVAYYNGKEVITQSVLREDYICINDEEVELCKGSFVPSFADTFSHFRGAFNHTEEDKDGWEYDEENKTVIKTTSNNEYSGVITSESYSNYDFKVKVSTQEKPTGHIGILASFAKDSDGQEHTLSFLRTGNKFVCKVDHCSNKLHSNMYNQIQLVATQTFNDSLRDGENTVVIQVTRNGNVITGKCSSFNDDKIIDDKSIIIDLDALSKTYAVLNLFKGSSPYGYATLAQGNVSFENLTFTAPNGRIFLLNEGKQYAYDFTGDGNWIESNVSKQDIIKQIGVGRFCYNNLTKKLFYTTKSTIIQVANISEPLPSFTEDDKYKALINNGTEVLWDLIDSDYIKGGWKEVNLSKADINVSKLHLKEGSAVYSTKDYVLYIVKNGELVEFGVESQLEELQVQLAVLQVEVNEIKNVVTELNERVETAIVTEEHEFNLTEEHINDKGKYEITIPTTKQYPNVIVVDNNNDECFCDVHYGTNEITLIFNDNDTFTEFSGKVYLN